MLGDSEKSAIATFEREGLPVSKGSGVRQKFTGGESLGAGHYTPLVEGFQPAIVCPPRRKGGNSYDAIAYKNAAGSLIKLSLGSIFNSIRVVTGMTPATLATGAKWAGETAQPTVNYFRYGALADMQGKEEVNEANESIACYSPAAFDLSVEVVYVAPRFEPGNNRPIFDSQCDLRRAFCVADYAAHPDTAAQR